MRWLSTKQSSKSKSSSSRRNSNRGAPSIGHGCTHVHPVTAAKRWNWVFGCSISRSRMGREGNRKAYPLSDLRRRQSARPWFDDPARRSCTSTRRPRRAPPPAAPRRPPAPAQGSRHHRRRAINGHREREEGERRREAKRRRRVQRRAGRRVREMGATDASCWIPPFFWIGSSEVVAAASEGGSRCRCSHGGLLTPCGLITRSNNDAQGNNVDKMKKRISATQLVHLTRCFGKK
jgi:hypothetical protein